MRSLSVGTNWLDMHAGSLSRAWGATATCHDLLLCWKQETQSQCCFRRLTYQFWYLKCKDPPYSINQSVICTVLLSWSGRTSIRPEGTSIDQVIIYYLNLCELTHHWINHSSVENQARSSRRFFWEAYCWNKRSYGGHLVGRLKLDRESI
jgi:hypothetical protein